MDLQNIKHLVVAFALLPITSCSLFATKQELITKTFEAKQSLDSIKLSVREQDLLVKHLTEESEKPEPEPQPIERCSACQSVENDLEIDMRPQESARRHTPLELNEELNEAKQKLERLNEVISPLQKEYDETLKKCMNLFSTPEEGRKECES